MPLAKNRSKLIVGAVSALFLIAVIFFVKNSISTEEIKTDTSSQKEPFEISPAIVYLQLPDGTNYRARLENKDTVEYLFDYLRNERGFKYEKVAYTYGTEIDNINSKKAPTGYKWAVYKGDDDITSDIDNERLENETTYVLRLVRKPQ